LRRSEPTAVDEPQEPGGKVCLDRQKFAPAVSWKTLGGAVHSMVDLRVLSCFNILRYEIPSSIVTQLPALYPAEFERLQHYTDLTKPVFYGQGS
jgi:hypothetical protein